MEKSKYYQLTLLRNEALAEGDLELAQRYLKQILALAESGQITGADYMEISDDTMNYGSIPDRF